VKRSAALLIGIAGAILALDIWTKRWATATLANREPVQLIGDFLRFTYTRNSGVAFGLGAGVPFPYYLFSIVAVGAIVWMFAAGRAQGRWRQIALALILGGAVGNLIDRVTTGEVVDFIEVGLGRFRWPVFNVADSAVTIGVILFGLGLTARPHQAATDAEAPSAALDEPDAGSLGPGTPRRGAVGPLPGGGADGPLP
jgi:signal peptidase II